MMSTKKRLFIVATCLEQSNFFIRRNGLDGTKCQYIAENDFDKLRGFRGTNNTLIILKDACNRSDFYILLRLANAANFIIDYEEN